MRTNTDTRSGSNSVPARSTRYAKNLFRFPRVTVGTFRPQGVEDVAYVDEAARKNARAAVVHQRIAAAVQHDVVFVGDNRCEIQLFVALHDDSRAIGPDGG